MEGAAGVRVSVLGLGVMGASVARALLRDGHEVTVWNRTAARAEPFAAEGATVSKDAATAVADADLAVLILPCYADVREVLESNGVIAALRDTIVVNLTTGHPDEASELDAWLASNGARYLDGRVGAYPEGLGTDHSNTFYAGSADAYQRALPALRSMGSDCRWVAENICAANELASSMVSVFHQVALVCFYEAVAMADHFGLSVSEWAALTEPMLRLTRDAAVRGGEQCAAGVYVGDQATLENHLDSLEMAERAMIGLDAPHAMTSAAVEYLRLARERGDGEREIAVLFDMLRRQPAGTQA